MSNLCYRSFFFFLGHNFHCYKSNVSYVIYANKAFSDSDTTSPIHALWNRKGNATADCHRIIKLINVLPLKYLHLRPASNRFTIAMLCHYMLLHRVYLMFCFWHCRMRPENGLRWLDDLSPSLNYWRCNNHSSIKKYYFCASPGVRAVFWGTLAHGVFKK